MKNIEVDSKSSIEQDENLVEIGETSDSRKNYTIFYHNLNKKILVVARGTETIYANFNLKDLYLEMSMVIDNFKERQLIDACCVMYQNAESQVSEDLWISIHKAMKENVIHSTDWLL